MTENKLSNRDRKRRRNKIIAGVIVGFLSVGLLASSLPAFFMPSGQQSSYPQDYNPESVKTVAELEEALQERPEDTGLMSELAGAYIRENQPNKAVEVYEKAISLAPGNGKLSYDLATAYYLTGEYEKAAGQAEEELKRNPDNKEMRFFYGQVLGYGLKNYPAAIEELEKYIELAGEGTDSVKARQIIEAFKERQ